MKYSKSKIWNVYKVRFNKQIYIKGYVYPPEDVIWFPTIVRSYYKTNNIGGVAKDGERLMYITRKDSILRKIGIWLERFL